MINKYSVICLVTAASLGGCGKKLLQKDPQARVISDNFYKSSQDFESAVAAAYDPLGWETDRAGAVYANPFFFGDVVSDDALKGGNGLGDQGNWYSIETFTANPNLQEFLLPWQRFYTGIYRSNLIIENSSNAKIDQGTVNRYVGEAKFLRAYYHFELVKYFGDVPLVTKSFSAEDFSAVKSPKAAVFAQIESDLQDAAGSLPEKGAAGVGRATKGAALSLLARAQMYQTLQNPAKWNDVLANSESVIKSGKYDLEAKFEDVLTLATEEGKESVFEIQHASSLPGLGGDNGSTWTRGNEGTVQNTMTRGRANGGWGFNSPSPSLISVMENDPRKAGTIIMNGDVVTFKNGDKVIKETYEINKDEYPFTGAQSRKYIESVDAKTMLNVSDGPSNIRAIRYADVLLMAAEAANELGKDTATVNMYLNKVRSRAGLAKNAVVGKDAVRQAIWDERRKELALEGHRFFDLVRQGRAAEVMQATPEGKNFRKGINEVFPIPQTEIDVAKGTITQNPGY